MASNLRRRLTRIERKIPQILEARKAVACICRGKGKAIYETNYHTAEELEKILWVPCPTHGLRDPGFIMWTIPYEPCKKRTGNSAPALPTRFETTKWESVASRRMRRCKGIVKNGGVSW